jgi:hypothetical protein
MIRAETFRADGDDLVRCVTPRSGRAYEHRCERAVFLDVLHTIDERCGDPFTYEQVRDATGHPASQVATAVAFLKERGTLVPAGHKRHRAATDAYLDGMLELLALAEEAAYLEGYADGQRGALMANSENVTPITPDPVR